MSVTARSGGNGQDEYARLRKVLEDGLRERGKLPELKKYEPSKPSIFGNPFSKETMAKLSELPGLERDLHELDIIGRALSEPALRDDALRYVRARDEVRNGGNTKG
jgi:hypothetical protein